MIGHHIGKMLTEAKRQRWVQLLLQTADEVGLKSDPEFRSAFVGYIEWGTRLAIINSQLTENPMVADEPMPALGLGAKRAGLTIQMRFNHVLTRSGLFPTLMLFVFGQCLIDG